MFIGFKSLKRYVFLLPKQQIYTFLKQFQQKQKEPKGVIIFLTKIIFSASSKHSTFFYTTVLTKIMFFVKYRPSNPVYQLVGLSPALLLKLVTNRVQHTWSNSSDATAACRKGKIAHQEELQSESSGQGTAST